MPRKRKKENKAVIKKLWYLKAIYWIIIIGVVGAVIGVITIGIFYLTNTGDMNEAEKVTNNFYSDLSTGNFESALPLLGPKLNKTKFNFMFNTLDDSLGRVVTYKRVSWKYYSNYSTSEWTLIYEVKRTKFISYETITLSRTTKDEPYLISEFEINSNGLTAEVLAKFNK